MQGRSERLREHELIKREERFNRRVSATVSRKFQGNFCRYLGMQACLALLVSVHTSSFNAVSVYSFPSFFLSEPTSYYAPNNSTSKLMQCLSMLP